MEFEGLKQKAVMVVAGLVVLSCIAGAWYWNKTYEYKPEYEFKFGSPIILVTPGPTPILSDYNPALEFQPLIVPARTEAPSASDQKPTRIAATSTPAPSRVRNNQPGFFDNLVSAVPPISVPEMPSLPQVDPNTVQALAVLGGVGLVGYLFGKST